MTLARGFGAALLLLGAEGVSPEQRPMCQMGCTRRGVRNQPACLDRCDALYHPPSAKVTAPPASSTAALRGNKAGPPTKEGQPGARQGLPVQRAGPAGAARSPPVALPRPAVRSKKQ